MARPRPLCVHLLAHTHGAGAENQCRYLLAGLRDTGDYDIELAYHGPGLAHAEFEALGIPMLLVPRLRRFRFDAYGRARRLRLAYSGRTPDILHTWLPDANAIGLLAARAWPHTKVVITQRGSWNESDYKALIRLQRLLLGRADQAISNSRGGADMLASLGMSRELISVIPNGIPPERVDLVSERGEVRRKLGWDAGDDVVIWVGRANDQVTAGHKDLPTLFDAVERLRGARPTAHLAMVGPTEQEIRERGMALPEWASSLGWQAHVADLINAADVLVISSRVEGNSNVAGEALLVGVPVATTDSGDHAAAVRRTGGRVVPVGDPGALAAAAAELLTNPPDRADVRRAAADALSVERMVRSHLEVYRSLLANR